jgi:hypothetical protein
LLRAFPLDVPMVPLSVLIVTTDSECLTCEGFSLSESVHHVSFEFITNYFNGLSHSPRMCDSRATFMGSTRSGTPSRSRAMIEDSTEKFLTMSSGEGGLRPPLS